MQRYSSDYASIFMRVYAFTCLQTQIYSVAQARSRDGHRLAKPRRSAGKKSPSNTQNSVGGLGTAPLDGRPPSWVHLGQCLGPNNETYDI